MNRIKSSLAIAVLSAALLGACGNDSPSVNRPSTETNDKMTDGSDKMTDGSDKMTDE